MSKKAKNKVNDGIYIGERTGVFNHLKRLYGADCSVVIPSSYSGPLSIIGGSGSGKTQCVVLQTLCRASIKGNFFAVDLKGDLYDKYVEANSGKAVKVFSLRGETEFCYEPFDFIHADTQDNLVSNMKEVVNALLPLPTNNSEFFWIYSAREYLTGALLYYYDLNQDFIGAVKNIMTTPPTELITMIGKCKNDMICSFINNFLGDTDLSDNKLLMGICQEVTNRLSVIANDSRVNKALSPGDKSIQWTDLNTHNIFLSVPEDRLEQYSPVVAMIITQLFRSLERRYEKHSIEGSSQVKVTVMLDEMPRLGKLDVIASAVSTLRSKSVTICMVFQSLAQLDAVYGHDVKRIIMDNCSYVAVFGVNDVESQKYFAERAGTVIVERRSRSTSYGPVVKSDNPIDPVYRHTTGYSETVSETREYAIQPHQFACLKDIVLFTPNGFMLVKKNPYHKTNTAEKSQSVIGKAIDKIVVITKNIANKVKSFILFLFNRGK